jgi:hypothetical protein
MSIGDEMPGEILEVLVQIDPSLLLWKEYVTMSHVEWGRQGYE